MSRKVAFAADSAQLPGEGLGGLMMSAAMRSPLAYCVACTGQITSVMPCHSTAPRVVVNEP